MWNNFDNLSSITKTTNFQKIQVPTYFAFGKRHLSVLHARIRNNCSNLNNDLFNNHPRDNPSAVGAMKERIVNTNSSIATNTETNVTNSLN